jgi:hypothetical protein
MLKTSGPLPLTFMLAMAVEASGASINSGGLSSAFKPGLLSPLLEQARAIGSSSGDQDAQKGPAWQTVQFPNFPNFPNCFSGNFRRC